MTEEAPKIRLPVINLPKILSTRDKIRDDTLDFVGCIMTGPLLDKLVRILVKRLKISRTESVRQACLHLVGKMTTAAELFDLAWRLSGNVSSLQRNLPVRPWSGQTRFEWVPVQISATRFYLRGVAPGRRGTPGRTIRMRIQAGSACPMVIEKFWSKDMCFFSGPTLGYSTKLEGPRPMLDPADLFNMRMFVRLDPRLCISKPDFKAIACSTSMVKHNRSVIDMRMREGFQCPKGYTHDCWKCPVGLDQCAAATHRHSFEAGDCEWCGERAWFDREEGWANLYCVKCQPLADSGVPKPKGNNGV